jgi:hypothetical protein
MLNSREFQIASLYTISVPQHVSFYLAIIKNIKILEILLHVCDVNCPKILYFLFNLRPHTRLLYLCPTCATAAFFC